MEHYYEELSQEVGYEVPTVVEISDTVGRNKFKKYKTENINDIKFYFATYEEFHKHIHHLIVSAEGYKNDPDLFMNSLMSCMLINEFRRRLNTEIDKFTGIQPKNEQHAKILENKLGNLYKNLENVPEKVYYLLDKLVFPGLQEEVVGVSEIGEEREQPTLRCPECNISGQWVVCPECNQIPEEGMLTAVHRGQVGTVDVKDILETDPFVVNMTALRRDLDLITDRLKTQDRRIIDRLLMESARDPKFNKNQGEHRLAIAKKIVDLDLNIVRQMDMPMKLLQKYVGKNKKHKRAILKYYDRALKNAKIQRQRG